MKGKNTIQPRISYDYNITTLPFFLLLKLSLEGILKTVLKGEFPKYLKKNNSQRQIHLAIFLLCLWRVGAVSLFYRHTYSQAFRMTDKEKRQLSSDSNNPIS